MTTHPSPNIRYHLPSDTYIISKKTFFEQDVLINGNVMVGPGVCFWKNVKIQGNAHFGKGCVIEGRLDAASALIGSQSVVKGPIHVSGDISLFQNTVVKSVESGGNVTIMDGCTADYINSKKLEIIGKAQVKKIGPITKMMVKADNMSCCDDYEEKNAKNSELETPIDSVFENDINADEKSAATATPSQQVNDQLTPLFPKEKKKEDAEFIVSGYPRPKLSEIASVPQDEMLNVELTHFETSEKEAETGFQIIETPFGPMVVGDGNPPVSEPVSDSAVSSQTSSAPQVSKRKPYPDFSPIEVSDEERKRHFSQNRSSQPAGQGAKSKSPPNTASAGSNAGTPAAAGPAFADPADKKKPPSKITFETLPLKAKDEKTEEKETPIKIVKKSAEEIEAEHANSKLWYEERVKPAQNVPKKHPPYL
jgi:hypothetical protein